MIRILLSTRLGERRWTQAKLSRISGVRAATISEWYNEIAERISGAQLHMYPQWGHGLYEEAKDFNALVLSFLKEPII